MTTAIEANSREFPIQKELTKDEQINDLQKRIEYQLAVTQENTQIFYALAERDTQLVEEIRAMKNEIYASRSNHESIIARENQPKEQEETCDKIANVVAGCIVIGLITTGIVYGIIRCG